MRLNRKMTAGHVMLLLLVWQAYDGHGHHGTQDQSQQQRR
jgi:hypothetical protein